MNFFKRIAEKVKALWIKKNKVALKVVPAAVKITEALKKVWDSPADEAIVSIIRTVTSEPVGFTAEKIRQGIEKFIPVCLLNLNMIKAIAEIEDPHEQMLAILDQFKFSNDTEKKQAYHLFCTHLIEYLSDGKLTWGECVKLSEEGFELYVLEKNGTS